MTRVPKDAAGHRCGQNACSASPCCCTLQFRHPRVLVAQGFAWPASPASRAGLLVAHLGALSFGMLVGTHGMHFHAQDASRFMAVEEALRICKTGRLEEPAPAAAKAPAEGAPAAAAAAPAAKPASAADAVAADDSLAPAKARRPWDSCAAALRQSNVGTLTGSARATVQKLQSMSLLPAALQVSLQPLKVGVSKPLLSAWRPCRCPRLWPLCMCHSRSCGRQLKFNKRHGLLMKLELNMHGLCLQIRDAREMLNERRSLSNKDVAKDAAKEAVKPAKPEPVKVVSACCFEVSVVQLIMPERLAHMHHFRAVHARIEAPGTICLAVSRLSCLRTKQKRCANDVV